jgi:hypothetical protein
MKDLGEHFAVGGRFWIIPEEGNFYPVACYERGLAGRPVKGHPLEMVCERVSVRRVTFRLNDLYTVVSFDPLYETLIFVLQPI